MKANVDGYYETMRVGTADNLTPRGEASEEIIMNRTAGGNNAIESGDALIKAIKGNSLVMNQMANVEKIIPQGPLNGLTFTFETGSIIVDGVATAEYSYNVCRAPVVEGHYYYIHAPQGHFNAGVILRRNMVVKAIQTYEMNTVFFESKVGETFHQQRFTVMMFDLTQMFGADNEPATGEEFAHRLGYDSIEQIPYIPYNEGEIVSCKAEGIRTTDAEGDTYERKWASTLQKYFPAGLKSAGPACDEITSTKAVKRIGVVDLGTLAWTKNANNEGCYYANVTTKSNKREACNVIVAGYTSVNENGTDVSILNRMPDRSVAGFYNPSSLNSWVYVRDGRYTSVEEIIAGVTGKLLYYELATPEEYEYDELNLTERVAQGGKEEAIVPEGVLSTPLKIDVVYPIDAYETIVNNRQHIGSLSLLQTSAKTDLVSAINENNQLAKDAYPRGGYMAELYKAGGAVYNEERDTWLLNGIELTNEEMSKVYRYTSNFGCFELTYSAFAYTDIRTNFIKKFSNIWKNDCLTFKDNCFAYSAIEYLNVYFNTIPSGSCSLIGKNIFLSCSKLHTINGAMLDNRTQRDNENSETFGKCSALKSFRLHSLKLELLLKDSQLITYDTIKYLIDNAANTRAITITFHPTTYAYITGTAEPTEEVGGTKAEWMALVSAAQEKQISFVQAE